MGIFKMYSMSQTSCFLSFSLYSMPTRRGTNGSNPKNSRRAMEIIAKIIGSPTFYSIGGGAQPALRRGLFICIIVLIFHIYNKIPLKVLRLRKTYLNGVSTRWGIISLPTTSRAPYR
jgi:hypothetical protein